MVAADKHPEPHPVKIVLCVALAGACITACAITAPAPGGAMRSGAFRQIQPTWAVNYGPAQATVTRNGGGQTPIRVSGNAQNVAGYSSMALLGSPIPISVGVRQSIGSAVDLAATLGVMDAGIELRAGPPDTVTQPWLISASARTGRVSILGTDTYEGRVKVEAYPRIVEDESRSLRLVLSVGMSAGHFAHVLALPDDRQVSEVPSLPPTVDILRPELRIETAFGIHRRTSGGSFTVAFAPWFVAANGTPYARPGSDWTVGDYSQGAGVSLLLSLSTGGDSRAPSAASGFTR